MDVRNWLIAELEERRRRNRRYSLRAFARDLGIDNSWLCKVLRGQRPVTPALLSRLEGVLPIPTQRPYPVVPSEVFEKISDPLHDRFLEVLKLRDFRPDLTWAAERLKLPLEKVQMIFGNLKEAGLLQVDAAGNWLDSTQGGSTHLLGPNQTSSSQREYQKEILRGAIEALDMVPIEQRHQSSMVVAVHRSRLGEAKQLVSRFRRDLAILVGDPARDCDDIYHLSVSLYPALRGQQD